MNRIHRLSKLEQTLASLGRIADAKLATLTNRSRALKSETELLLASFERASFGSCAASVSRNIHRLALEEVGLKQEIETTRLQRADIERQMRLVRKMLSEANARERDLAERQRLEEIASSRASSPASDKRRQR